MRECAHGHQGCNTVPSPKSKSAAFEAPLQISACDVLVSLHMEGRGGPQKCPKAFPGLFTFLGPSRLARGDDTACPCCVLWPSFAFGLALLLKVTCVSRRQPLELTTLSGSIGCSPHKARFRSITACILKILTMTCVHKEPPQSGTTPKTWREVPSASPFRIARSPCTKAWEPHIHIRDGSFVQNLSSSAFTV